MDYAVDYRPEVEKEDFPPIPRNLQIRILRAIESRLKTAPTRYGQRLRRSLSDLWKLRVGDYRVVYEIRGHQVTIWAIRQRKEVYDEAEKRRMH
ncbi:MAG TPA: type II toxin-antitoxin system RelE/ParE family toxin [Elusimicrobia bacterium]|nr:MAG: hypothetical protein A2X37_08825 [Elusimicrobia bacterium GWA2_66_18]OGR68718.1 MAG: hypothetical protein A2X40_12075 [Elusimicrobia bacterium GWC2_65_9]HAZ08602.1 type II toxin-antitoxin system RelE/ParE family toxin [Elusimicrobiota bacterium]